MADVNVQQPKGTKKKRPHAPRNYQLPGGVWRYGRSAIYQRRRNYLKKNLNKDKKVKKRVHYKIKPIGGEKNGGTRLILTRKSRKWYPSEDTPRPLRRNYKPKPCKLRPSLTPGTVLILLAGRHEGKRVVFLKQLPSGLLLVTGPYKFNRVPLRRVNQAYVIATSTKVDVSGVEVPGHLDDDYFKRKRLGNKKGKKANIFENPDAKYKVSDKRKQDQKDVDGPLLKAISKVDCLQSYLRHKFSLSNGQYPHRMVF